jgi:hypothetical protein
MKRNNSVTIVDQVVIPHTALVNPKRQIRQSFAFSGDMSEAEDVAIIGESGTGKTSTLGCGKGGTFRALSSACPSLPRRFAGFCETPAFRGKTKAELDSFCCCARHNFDVIG